MAKKKLPDKDQVVEELERLSQAVIASYEEGTDEEVAAAEKAYESYAAAHSIRVGVVEEVLDDDEEDAEEE